MLNYLTFKRLDKVFNSTYAFDARRRLAEWKTEKDDRIDEIIRPNLGEFGERDAAISPAPAARSKRRSEKAEGKREEVLTTGKLSRIPCNPNRRIPAGHLARSTTMATILVPTSASPKEV